MKIKKIMAVLALLTLSACGTGCRREPHIKVNEELKMPPVYNLRPPVSEKEAANEE